jgi:hypothetical protein
MADKLGEEWHHMAETLYDMYCRIAEMSHEEPLSSTDLADAWMQYEFDPASGRLAEVVRKQWQIGLHPTLYMGLDTLTDDMLDYLHEHGTHYWLSEGQVSDRWDGTATLYSGWVEDIRFAENIYVLVPDDDLANLRGRDQIVAITEAKLKEAPYAEGPRGGAISQAVEDDDGNVIGSRQTTSRGQEHYVPEDGYDDYVAQRAFEAAERREAWDTGELDRAISYLRKRLDDPERPLDDDN